MKTLAIAIGTTLIVLGAGTAANAGETHQGTGSSREGACAAAERRATAAGFLVDPAPKTIPVVWRSR